MEPKRFGHSDKRVFVKPDCPKITIDVVTTGGIVEFVNRVPVPRLEIQDLAQRTRAWVRLIR